MAKKQEVVDTWGRLAERVNSQAATRSPQSSAPIDVSADACRGCAAEADASEANLLGGAAVHSTAKGSSIDLDGPELDDVD
eukprot:COSAG02_NODE_10251_length_1986_cov_2.642289_1_plen_81_part_00